METPRVDFIGIGAQKCATSWLYRCLTQHPQVRTAVGPRKKEVHFFNQHYDRGYGWYHQNFEFGDWLAGEYSTLYFYEKSVPERIYKYRRDVKLILSLRNPIDRAFSQHTHEIKTARLPRELYDFEKALELNPSYIEQGKYASALERFLEFFDQRQIHIIWFDDIVSKPSTVICELYTFLGIDTTFHPPVLFEKRNASYALHSPQLYRTTRGLNKTLTELFGELPVRAARKTKIPELIHRLNQRPIDAQIVPRLKLSQREQLRLAFNDELVRLAEMTGRDLTSWV